MAESDTCSAVPIPLPNMRPAGPVPPPNMCPAEDVPPHGANFDKPPAGWASRRCEASDRPLAYKFRGKVGKKNVDCFDQLPDGSFRDAMPLHHLPDGSFRDAMRLRHLRMSVECEDEEMEHLSEPASAQALQLPDVDTTLEDSQPWGSMLPSLPRSLLEEYDAAYAHKCVEHQPVRGTASAKRPWHFPRGFECLYPGLSAHDADIIRGAAEQMVAVTAPSEELSMTATSLSSSEGTIAVSPASGRCLFLSSIRLREERNWGLTFYIRVNILGSYHTYPCVGGLFQSLQEANDAIDRYLKDHRDPTVCLEPNEIPLEGKARVDYVVRRCIFWPDGTRKRRLISEPVDERRCWMDQLVKALVDKYNEDYNLVEGDAYEYKALVLYEIIWEGNDSYYYHINFTAKTKGAHDSDPGHLFYAEVTHIPGERENMVVTCISIINPSDEGCCYGCEIGMKHPSTAAYFGGHLDVGYGPCCPIAGPDEVHGPYKEWKGTDDDAKEEEVRLRRLFGPGDPSVTEQLMKPYVKSEDGSWILPDSVEFQLIY